MFPGQKNSETTYWIGLKTTDSENTEDNYWVVTSSSMIGNPLAYNEVNEWEHPNPDFDAIYTWENECTPMLSVEGNYLSNFKFYPNPSTDVLHVSAGKNIDTVTVFNMLGQELVEINIQAPSSIINIAHLEPGTYLMKVLVDESIGTYKILKK